MIPTDRAFKYAEEEISTMSEAACVTVHAVNVEGGRQYTVTAPGFGPVVRFTVLAKALAGQHKKSALLEHVRALWEETMRLVWDRVRKLVPATVAKDHEQKTAETGPAGGLPKTGIFLTPGPAFKPRPFIHGTGG